MKVFLRIFSAFTLVALTSACGPSIEEVEKQVRTDLERDNKALNLRVNSLKLQKRDGVYEGSLLTTEKAGSFSYSVKVSKNEDRFESAALPTDKSVEHKLIALMNEKLAELERQVIKLDVTSKNRGNYYGHATVQKINHSNEYSRDPEYAETTCSFSGTLRSISNFSYKFSFSKRDVQQSVDNYMDRRLSDGRSVYGVETRISRVTADQYTGVFDTEGLSPYQYADEPIDAYLDDQDCSIVLKGDFSRF